MSSLRTVALVLTGLLAVWPAGSTARAEPTGELTPCLAAAADNSALWPTGTFPAGGKQMVAVFHLGEGEKFAKLSSRWVVIDVGQVAPPGTELGKADVELMGARSGRFRYSQQVPLPFGKYRLEVHADGKPWKSADLEVVADSPPISLNGPSDLLPLREGQVWEYDVTVESAPAAGSGGTGKETSRLTVKVGPKESPGWRVEVSVDGQPRGHVWWDLTDAGLMLTQIKEGETVRRIDPPRPIVPLVKASPMAWTWQPEGGSDRQECRLWGPVPVDVPGVEKSNGYFIVSEQPIDDGGETTAQVFVPGYGMVAEVRIIADKTGKRVRRQLTTPAGPPAYRIVARSEMRGRMGRLVVGFPKDSKTSGTPVEVYSDADLKQKTENAYGPKTFDLLPGKYWVSISEQVVPLEVRSRCETVVATGALKIELSGNTGVEIYADKECKKKLANFYGSREVGLPVGAYYVLISGKVEPVRIEEGKITEF